MALYVVPHSNDTAGRFGSPVGSLTLAAVPKLCTRRKPQEVRRECAAMDRFMLQAHTVARLSVALLPALAAVPVIDAKLCTSLPPQPLPPSPYTRLDGLPAMLLLLLLLASAATDDVDVVVPVVLANPATAANGAGGVGASSRSRFAIGRDAA